MATEKAILAGGCFWGVQDLIRKLPGVTSTRVGYTGGDVPNATYRNHAGHAEAIEIVFDPGKISYRDLLEFFFQIHDPSTRNRQGNDIGTSYRSAIFYLSEEQRQTAQDTIADVDASGLWPGKVVTEVTPAGPFWQAEPEHQDYLERYPDGYTCPAGQCQPGRASQAVPWARPGGDKRPLGMILVLSAAGGGPVQRPGQRRGDDDGQHVPRVDVRRVHKDGGQRQARHHEGGHVPVVADDEVVPERAERLKPLNHGEPA